MACTVTPCEPPSAFLSSDTRYKLEGHTVLYIPTEAVNLKPEAVVKDKELVQRLESEWLAFPVGVGILRERKGGSPEAKLASGWEGSIAGRGKVPTGQRCKDTRSLQPPWSTGRGR